MKNQEDIPHKKKNEQLKSYARFSSIAFQMVVIICVGTFVGVKLDETFPNKHNLYTLICVLLGVIFATIYVIRRIIALSKNDK